MNRELDLRAALAVVRAEKRMKRTQNTVPVGQAMKHQGMQIWRPKVTAQCVSTDAAGTLQENVASIQTGSVEVLAAVIEDDSSNKVDKVSVSVEVDQGAVKILKAKRNQKKRNIETRSNTSLSFSKDDERFHVVIEGVSDESLQQATKLVQALIEKKAAKAEPAARKSSSIGTASMKASASSTKASASGALQWLPKAVRAMHTVSSADDCRDIVSDEVEPKDGGTISGCIQVDKKLLRLVKGHKNEVKERIEKETDTSIRFGNPVVVEGSSEESVRKALEQIQKIIEEGVNDAKFQYSHFISLPLSVHPALVKKLEAFQESILVSVGMPLLDDEEKTAVADVAPEEENAAADEELAGNAAAKQEAAEVETVPTGNIPSDEAPVLERAADDAEAAQVGDAFQQSVLGSLGLQQNEDDVAVDAAFKETVLGSLGIPDAATEAGNRPVVTLHVQDETLANESDEAAETLPDAQTGEVEKTEPEQAAEMKAANDEPEQMTEGREADEGSQAQVEMENITAEKKNVALPDVPLTVKKNDSGIEKSIFIKPTRFHLTILMLKLWNEERVEQAREVLEKCLPDVVAALEGRPVSVSLQGLDIMRGSPKNTRVLFAKVAELDGGSRLPNACRTMIDAFVESGLVLGKDREQELKLHATVMNTSHRRSKSRYKNKGFDATDILAQFGEEKWGDYRITEAHLSERFKYDEDGYYHCCCSVPFPGSEAATKTSVPEETNQEQ